MRRDAGGSRPRLVLDNRSGYVTSDLHRLFARAMVAMGVRETKTFVVVSAPARSRGCAELGALGREGKRVVIAISPPSRFRMRRLARLLVHELSHTRGQAHHDMDEDTLWSRGDVPTWARGVKLRYRGRAPRQL